MGYGDYSILQHETMTELVRKFPVQQHIGKALFKEKKIDTNVAEWDIIHQSRDMADYASVDGEGHIVKRMGVQKQTATTAYLREKKQIEGSSLAWLRKPGTEDKNYGEELIRNELEDLNRRLEKRKEWARWQALSGTLTVNQADVKFVVDYGIDASHKPTVGTAWSNIAADIINDLKTWKALIEKDSGEKAKTLYVNETVMAYLCKNTNIIALMSDDLSKKLLQEGIITKLAGLEIVVYNSGYVPAGGSYTYFIPDDVAVMVTENGFARELTAPSTEMRAGRRPGKFSKSWEQEDPSGVWVLIEEHTLPVIEKVENIIYADLTP